LPGHLHQCAGDKNLSAWKFIFLVPEDSRLMFPGDTRQNGNLPTEALTRFHAAAVQSSDVEITNPTLLQRAGAGMPDAWDRFDRLYRPFLLGWFRGHGVDSAEAGDLTQEVMLVILKQVKSFAHPGHRGAFRNWLRGVCLNQLLGYRRKRRVRGVPVGGSDFQHQMQEVGDSAPDAAAEWDARHDHAVLRQLFDSLAGEFEPQTLRAFCRIAFDGVAATEVARELKMSIGAVYIAKSRVLRRLRAEADGLLEDAVLV
jgi:RNA polymerase sigma-70 factor (ECF subfamily)